MTAADIVAALFDSCGHPDIIGVERYGKNDQAVMVRYRAGAEAFFEPTTGKTAPVDLPEQMPAYKFRAQHALKLLVGLLEAAKPAGVTGWRLVSINGVDLAPCGIELRTDSGVVLLRVFGGSPTGLDADPSEWADWRIPDSLTV